VGVLGMLWRSQRMLRGLHLGCVDGTQVGRTHWDAGLWAMLQNQRELEELSFELNEAEDGLNTSLLLPLKSLTLAVMSAEGRVSDLVNTLISSGESTLTRLSFALHLSSEEFDTPAFYRLRNLRHVQLSLAYAASQGVSQKSQERQRCRDLLDALPSSVQSLTLADKGDHQLHRRLSLDFLPTTLLSLDTRHASFSPSMILYFLRSFRCPNLRQLHYFNADIRRKRPSGWDDSTRLEVAALLKERGIEGN
jgi:hypothetical protein